MHETQVSNLEMQTDPKKSIFSNGVLLKMEMNILSFKEGIYD